MKKNYINPDCELLNFANVTMLHVSTELNDADESLITFGSGGTFSGTLFE